MDSASTGDDRLREIVDHLLSSPGLTARDRLLLDEAKAILTPAARPTITLRHDPHTVPEPAVVTVMIGRAGR